MGFNINAKIIKTGTWLNNNLTKVWLVLALSAGLLCVFVIPPLHGNDEIVHFPRAYHIHEGFLWNKHLGGYDYGGYVLPQIKQFNDDFRSQVQNSNPSRAKLEQFKRQYSHERLDHSSSEREPLAFTSAGVYSAWSYLPAVIGVKIADTLSLPLIWYVYLARIMCLLVWVGLTYLALKFLPFGRPLLFAVALLPTSIVQATTMGMDGLVNGLSWFIIALTLAVLSKKVKARPLILTVLAVLSTYLATTKQGYVLISALPLLIPAASYPFSKKVANIMRVGFGFFLILLSFWYFRQTAPIADIMHFIQRPGLFVDSAAQWRYILQHPLAVLSMILLHPFSFGYGGIYAGVVGVLTNRLVHLPIVTIALLYFGMMIAALGSKKDKIAKADLRRAQVGAALVLFGTFVLINLALYVSFTQVGFKRVEGIQGRYFLPLLPLIAVWTNLLSPKRAARFQPYALTAVFLISIAGLMSALGAIIS